MENLTEREIAVLKLIMLGYPNSQISKKIFISTHTVKAHIASIMRKLNAKNLLQSGIHKKQKYQKQFRQ